MTEDQTPIEDETPAPEPAKPMSSGDQKWVGLGCTLAHTVLTTLGTAEVWANNGLVTLADPAQGGISDESLALAVNRTTKADYAAMLGFAAQIMAIANADDGAIKKALMRIAANVGNVR